MFDCSSTKVEAGEEEEVNCPICLLEMVEGESITECGSGCGNKFHHHCIAIWFEECRQQTEPLTCPLCRNRWQDDNVDTSASVSMSHGEAAPVVPPNTRASSPQPTVADTDILLPSAEPIAAEFEETATPWIPVRDLDD